VLAGANAGRITLGLIVRSWLCASDWISQGPLSGEAIDAAATLMSVRTAE
jgi:hypothetical protein